MFQKVNSWLTVRGEKFARSGDASRIPGNAYYASNEAEQAYGGMRKPAPDMPLPPDNRNIGADTGRTAAVDRFSGDASDKYAGRVPYRSQKDIQAEADTQRQQFEEQQRRQQSAGQRQQPQQFGRPAAQAAYQQPQQPSNVLPFPGMIRGPEGNLYAHVEYVVLLRSRNECTKVIEYIKANASVFLNMEFIANDSERQRCVDMLSGAAYTLGCALSKISQRGIYLISSPSVYVVIDPAMQKYATAQEAQGYVRPEYSNPPVYGAGAQTAAYGAGAQTGAYAAQPAAYGAGAQTGAYAAQSGAGYATGARTAAYTARQNAGYGAGAQPAAYASRPAAGFGAGAQTGAYQAQPAVGYTAESRPTPFASQPTPGYGAGSQTAPFAAQRQGGYGANPATPLNANAPTGGYAAAQQAAPAPARRAGAPFGMQGAFVKNGDGTQGR